jgi:glucan phosphorylase
MSPESAVSIAYSSMEIAANEAWPTYAGDMLRSAADRGLPIVGVTLLSTSRVFPTTS